MIPTPGKKETPANPFDHPYVRIERVGADRERYVESVVYNVKTGEAVRCWPIDGREMVASGEWSWTKPAAIVPISAPASMDDPPVEEAPPLPESLNPSAAGSVASTFKRGPGRPRKSAH